MNKNLAIVQTRLERYIEISKTPEIYNNYNSIEQMIVKAGLNNSIESLSEPELIKVTSTMAEFICRDLGITERHREDEMVYSSARFMMILKTHFISLTVQDIKLAFELLEVGTLDSYLPADRNGKPDREHYQSFNVRFYTKVLNAYKAYKTSVFGKGQRKLFLLKESGVNIISPEQRKENRQETLNDIYNAFNEYKFKGTKPNFILSLFINSLIEREILKLPIPTKKDLNIAKRDVLLNKSISRAEKKVIVSNYNNGKKVSQILNQAQIDANNKAIVIWFDEMIKNKTNIKDVLK